MHNLLILLTNKYLGCKNNDEFTIMNAHKEIQWVPVDRLLEYDLAPADVPIARQLLSAKKDSQW